MNGTPKQPSQPQPLDAPLKGLSERELDLLRDVLKRHPDLTPEKALKALQEAGM